MAKGRRHWSDLGRIMAAAVLMTTAGACIVTDEPGVPFDFRVAAVGIVDELDVHLGRTRIHLTDGTTVETLESHIVTGDPPRPGDLVLAFDDPFPTFVGSFGPDGADGDGPCYRIEGEAELAGDLLRLTFREGDPSIRFTVDLAPGWDERPPAGGGSAFDGESTCLDAQGRAVERRSDAGGRALVLVLGLGGMCLVLAVVAALRARRPAAAI